MVLMMLFMGGMAYAMPKLMDMDEETKEEIYGKVWRGGWFFLWHAGLANTFS